MCFQYPQLVDEIGNYEVADHFKDEVCSIINENIQSLSSILERVNELNVDCSSHKLRQLTNLTRMIINHARVTRNYIHEISENWSNESISNALQAYRDYYKSFEYYMEVTSDIGQFT